MSEIYDKPLEATPAAMAYIVVLSLLSFVIASYGAYALYQADLYFIARGNLLLGTLIRLEATEARMASTLYIGSGVWLFNAQVLNRLRYTRKYALSWLGAALMSVGIISLVFSLGFKLVE